MKDGFMFIRCVRQSIPGADRRQNLYFRTRNQAEKYSRHTDYTDKPHAVRMEKDKAEQLIFQTDCFFNPDLYM